MLEIKIEKGIGLSGKKMRSELRVKLETALEGMSEGDSFWVSDSVVPIKKVKCALSGISNARKDLKFVVRTKMTDDDYGIRVWRVA